MATLTRRAALPELPKARCPAALAIAGADQGSCGIVCRVMKNERATETGEGLNAAQTALARDGSDGVFLTLTGDPSTVERFCCADDDPPVLDSSEKAGGRDTYTYCPVWQAEKLRIEQAREQLAGGGVEPEAEPEQVAHWDDGRGNSRQAPAGSSYDSADPWAKAKRDLDILAPQG